MKGHDYWDKLISDKTLFYKCIDMYEELKTLAIDVGQLNSSITRTYGDVVENYEKDGGTSVNN